LTHSRPALPRYLESWPSMGGRLEIVAGRWRCGSGEGEERVTRGGEHTRISTSGVKSPIIREVTWLGERLPGRDGCQDWPELSTGEGSLGFGREVMRLRRVAKDGSCWLLGGPPPNFLKSSSRRRWCCSKSSVPRLNLFSRPDVTLLVWEFSWPPTWSFLPAFGGALRIWMVNSPSSKVIASLSSILHL